MTSPHTSLLPMRQPVAVVLTAAGAAAAAAAVEMAGAVGGAVAMTMAWPTSSRRSIATIISLPSRTPGRGAARVAGGAGMRR